jgi:hypothetical protein
LPAALLGTSTNIGYTEGPFLSRSYHCSLSYSLSFFFDGIRMSCIGNCHGKERP